MNKFKNLFKGENKETIISNLVEQTNKINKRKDWKPSTRLNKLEDFEKTVKRSRKISKSEKQNIYSEINKTREVLNKKQQFIDKTSKNFKSSTLSGRKKERKQNPVTTREGFKYIFEKEKSIEMFKKPELKGSFKDFYDKTIGKNVENKPTVFSPYTLEVELNASVLRKNNKNKATNKPTIGVSEREMTKLVDLGKEDSVKAMNYLNNLILAKFVNNSKYRFINQKGNTLAVTKLTGIYRG